MEGDIHTLRKKLRSADCQLFDSFPPYAAWFRRRFGIEHEQALELFHQTVSMKSVGNLLTDFVRNHMLEPFDVGSRIESLIGHFDDLDRAQQAVLKAKRQVEMLTPLVENGARHRQLTDEIERWRQARDQLRPYFARLKGQLLERRLDLLAQEAARLDARIERLEAEREAARVEIGRLERAMRDQGGDRLEELAAEIRRLQQEKVQRQQRADRYHVLLARMDEPAPEDEAGFLALQQGMAQRAEALRTQLADLDNREREEDFAFRKGREEHTALTEEIDSLARRKSNIDTAQIRIREALCAALGLPEDELPFAGELIQVRAEERDWEGAAERLLRGFGLALLVPDGHYRAVATWVDRQHLGARLVYFHVRPRKVAPGASLHPQSLVRKLVIKPDSPHHAWLEQELQSRFDFACCDTPEQFQREARAITRAGQIKEPGGRHEKDDRSRIDNRSRYVLGWSNADKLRALRDARAQLEARLAVHAQRISELSQSRRELQGRLDALNRLEEFTRFADIDWMSLARRIATLTEERTRLETAPNTLQELGRQLRTAQDRLGELEGQYAELLGKRGEIKNKHETAQAMRNQAALLWQQAPLTEAQIGQLDQ
ncbi:Chromosome partition protein Smc [Tepidimonas charontis]|uniref:Chromosome partition protein Smc n=1 Tax=Tepidimonas charontis TaxID=2267262 RepID=A0A554XHB7_9BURK|nr:Chromosome partition protein Smc [Tepidimonas charontis]